MQLYLPTNTNKLGFCREQRYNYNVSKFKYCVSNFELFSLLWSFSNDIKLIMSHHKYGVLFGPQAIIWSFFNQELIKKKQVPSKYEGS